MSCRCLRDRAQRRTDPTRACRSTLRTASIAKPATSKTRPRISCGKCRKGAVGPNSSKYVGRKLARDFWVSQTAFNLRSTARVCLRPQGTRAVEPEAIATPAHLIAASRAGSAPPRAVLPHLPGHSRARGRGDEARLSCPRFLWTRIVPRSWRAKSVEGDGKTMIGAAGLVGSEGERSSSMLSITGQAAGAGPLAPGQRWSLAPSTRWCCACCGVSRSRPSPGSSACRSGNWSVGVRGPSPGSDRAARALRGSR